MTTRSGYCPIGNEPCQSLCETPCGSRQALTDEQIQVGHDAADIAPTDSTIGTFIEGVRFAEAAHGITAQQGGRA